MLTIDDFEPVSLDDRACFLEQYRLFPPVHSDNTFTNIVCWNHYAHYRFAKVRDSLVICSTIDGKVRFRAPIGPDDPALLDDLFSLAKSESPDGAFFILDPVSRERIASRYPTLALNPVRDLYEYVYRSADLADLPGKGYLTIRRHISRFHRNCSNEVEAITPENMEEVRVFVNRWCNWKDCENDPLLAGEREAVLFALAHFRELELQGLAVRVEGEVAAMTVFEQMNHDTGLVHFEKGLPDCEGIYKAINQETARRLRDACTFINRESDMGVPGLREAKSRYHPDHMVEVHAIAVGDL